MYFLATVTIVAEIAAIGDSYMPYKAKSIAKAAPRSDLNALRVGPEPQDIQVLSESSERMAMELREGDISPEASGEPAPVALRGQEPLGSELRYTPEQVAKGELHRYKLERQFHHLSPAEKKAAIADLNARQQARRTRIAEQAAQGRETYFGVDYEPTGYHEITAPPAVELPEGLGLSLPKNPEQLIAGGPYRYQFRSIDTYPNRSSPVVSVHNTGVPYRALTSHFLEWVRLPR
jgi:hypothetical protein